MKSRTELSALILLLLGSTHAQAADIASAQAWLDLSSFSVIGSGQQAGSAAPSVVWSNQGTKYDLYSFLNNAAHGRTNDWTSLINGTSGDAIIYSKITDSATSLLGNAYDANLANPAAGASVSTLLSGNFTVIGSGTLDFTINYSVTSDLAPTATGGSALAYVFLNAQQVPAGNTYPLYTVQDQAYLDNAGANLGHLANSGMLDLKLSVSDGQIYSFQAENFASVGAAVPLPAAVWFFLSGMLGYLSLIRHKNV